MPYQGNYSTFDDFSGHGFKSIDVDRETRAIEITAMVQGLVLFKGKQISRKKEQMHGFYLQ